MTTKQKVKLITELLEEHYKFDPDECHLNYSTPIELLVATILAAQCTDARVNIVTVALFEKYKNVYDFANADVSELESLVHSTGFYKAKSKNIIATSQIIVKNFDGIVPCKMEDLTSFPGVGRKTANVVRSHIFKLPTVIVDTHVKRISFRLGLTKNTDPTKIEYDLMKVLPKDTWIRFNHQIIILGRNICKAPTPKCDECFLTHCCKFFSGR